MLLFSFFKKKLFSICLLFAVVLPCCLNAPVLDHKTALDCISIDRWKTLVAVFENNEVFVRRGPLTHAEYICMINFKNDVGDVVKKIVEEKKEHEPTDNYKLDVERDKINETINYFTGLVRNMKNDVDNKVRAQKKTVRENDEYIMDCKVYMRDLVAKSSWLDVYTFADASSNDKAFKKLGEFFETSNTQNKRLDKEILKKVYDEHRRKALGKREPQVVIAGAGMAGLYSALQFFRSGMKVVLVNDRSEEYERELIIGFDMNWREQMRFFLGTKFKELFEGDEQKKPVGRLTTSSSSFWIGLKKLENALKERLKELAALEENVPLELIYDTEVSEIKFPQTGNDSFEAVLTPSRRKQHVHVHQNTTGSSSSNKLPGIPKVKTAAKSYTRVVFKKGSKMSDNEILGKNGDLYPIYFDITKVKNEFERLYSNKSFSYLQKKYSNIFEDMFKKTEDEKTMIFGMFENVDNRHSFYVLGEVPAKLGDLVEEINAQIKKNKLEKGAHKINDYTKQKKDIEKMYISAVTNALLRPKNKSDLINQEGEKNEKKISFNDEDRLNTAIFKIANHVVDQPVKRYVVNDKSAIVLAVGDALANNHYFNGAGFSTARIAVDRAAQAVLAYPVHSKKGGDLEKNLTQKLNEVQEIVVKTSSEYLKLLPEQEQNILAKRMMCEFLNNLSEKEVNGIKILKNTTHIDPENPSFSIQVNGKLRAAKVTENGKILVDKKIFNTPIEVLHNFSIYVMDMNKTGHGSMKHMNGTHHHMWMYFHTIIDDTVLFDFWTVNSVEGMAVSCIILFLAGVGFEALKWSRLMVENRWKKKQSPRNSFNIVSGSINPHSSISASLKNRYSTQLFSGAHLIQTVLFSVQVLWGYLLMLVFMTFSVWLGLAVVLGATTGFYLFSGAVRTKQAFSANQPPISQQHPSSSADIVTSTGMHGCA